MGRLKAKLRRFAIRYFEIDDASEYTIYIHAEVDDKISKPIYVGKPGEFADVEIITGEPIKIGPMQVSIRRRE